MDRSFALALQTPFQIKTTEAPSYRRIALSHISASRTGAVEAKLNSLYRGFQNATDMGSYLSPAPAGSSLRDSRRLPRAMCVPVCW